MRAFENRIVYNGSQVASYEGAIAGPVPLVPILDSKIAPTHGYPVEGNKVI